MQELQELLMKFANAAPYSPTKSLHMQLHPSKRRALGQSLQRGRDPFVRIGHSIEVGQQDTNSQRLPRKRRLRHTRNSDPCVRLGSRPVVAGTTWVK
jgi:hypothetical protein